MVMHKPLLTDAQWKKIEPLLPRTRSPRKGRRRGRPPKPHRAVLEGILWILKTGARWQDLPRDFGVSPSVCWKRLGRARRRQNESSVWRVRLILGSNFHSESRNPLANRIELLRCAEMTFKNWYSIRYDTNREMYLQINEDDSGDIVLFYRPDPEMADAFVYRRSTQEAN